MCFCSIFYTQQLRIYKLYETKGCPEESGQPLFPKKAIDSTSIDVLLKTIDRHVNRYDPKYLKLEVEVKLHLLKKPNTFNESHLHSY